MPEHGAVPVRGPIADPKSPLTAVIMKISG